MDVTCGLMASRMRISFWREPEYLMSRRQCCHIRDKLSPKNKKSQDWRFRKREMRKTTRLSGEWILLWTTMAATEQLQYTSWSQLSLPIQSRKYQHAIKRFSQANINTQSTRKRKTWPPKRTVRSSRHGIISHLLTPVPPALQMKAKFLMDIHGTTDAGKQSKHQCNRQERGKMTFRKNCNRYGNLPDMRFRRNNFSHYVHGRTTEHAPTNTAMSCANIHSKVQLWVALWFEHKVWGYDATDLSNMRIHEHILGLPRWFCETIEMIEGKKRRLSTESTQFYSTFWYACYSAGMGMTLEFGYRFAVCLQYLLYRGMCSTCRRKYSKRRRSGEFWLVQEGRSGVKLIRFLTLWFWFLNGSFHATGTVVLNISIRILWLNVGWSIAMFFLLDANGRIHPKSEFSSIFSDFVH